MNLRVYAKSMLRQLPPRVKRWLRGSWHLREASGGGGESRRAATRFLATQSSSIRGRVLCLGNAALPRRSGSGIESLEVLDSDPTSHDVTILADLAEAGSIPRGAFDCVLLIKLLAPAAQLEAALSNAWEGVAPGGALLVTTPASGEDYPTEPNTPASADVTPAFLRQVLERACPEGAAAFACCDEPLACISVLKAARA